MMDLTLTQSFSLIALNGQRSLEMTVPKKVALRCMAAAVIVELYMENGFTHSQTQLTLSQEVLNQSRSLPYRDVIVKSLARKNESIGDLRNWLRRASSLPASTLKKLESAVAQSLRNEGILEEIPHILGSDLYFHTAGVSIKEYRTHPKYYTSITEFLRADILEDGEAADETVAMLWLLRESGCLLDFFSRNEMEQVSAKMIALYKGNALAQVLYATQIRRGMELGIKQYFRMKKKAIKTPVGSGLNFVFPVLERSQAIFIDTEKMFPNPTARLHDVRTRLESKGHIVNVLKDGDVPIIKVDNVIYDAVPHAVYGRVPIHGVRLVPKCPF